MTRRVRAVLCDAWQLDRLPKPAGVELRRSAHQLGYRSHSSIKIRGCSTTGRRLPPAGDESVA
jgi:hypothetical protein